MQITLWPVSRNRYFGFAAIALAATSLGLLAAPGDEPSPVSDKAAAIARLADNHRFFAQSQQPTGLLIPLYSYPAHIHRNAAFNTVIDLKKSYPTVPVCVIVNPANGPGEGELDANYVKAIDRLYGAGVVTLGYVSTRYAQQPPRQVQHDIAAWKTRYPRVNGIFFDEMANADEASNVNYYVTATRTAHDAGFWPVFANPGAATPEPFFARQAADVFVVHETEAFPTEESLRGDYFGGYADYPPFTRSVLVHSQKNFDRAKFAMISKQTRWVYVTHDQFDAKGDSNDPRNNPWDEVSEYLETMFRELSGRR
ncbi:MAG: hypothetical protein EXS05_04655 [Planctomycetaceae bacterium]|nr:hypothetical protein [Planctomycetaceae bacterium]